MKTERSDFGKTKVLSPTESNVKIEQVIYFKKYKNMLHNISELSSGAVRSKFNILYELEGLHPCGLARIHTIYWSSRHQVITNSKESSLACLPEFIKILWFRLPCFLFHPTPDMLNDVHVWWLGWPILEHLDLRLEELWCRDGSMRWSTILLQNVAPFMVGNVRGS